MAIRFEKLAPGMTLYDRHKTRMGNTTLKSIGEWRVKIVSVDAERRSAIVSWNGNRPETWSAHRLAKLSTWSMYDAGVEVKRGLFGAVLKVSRAKKSPSPSQSGV